MILAVTSALQELDIKAIPTHLTESGPGYVGFRSHFGYSLRGCIWIKAASLAFRKQSD